MNDNRSYVRKFAGMLGRNLGLTTVAHKYALRRHGVKGIREHLRHVHDLAAAELNSNKPEAFVRISLVAPVYNAPSRYLDALLLSFEAQQFPGAELILSDDGSTSVATQSWLKSKVGWPGLKIVFAEKNGGIAVASNAGLALATGEWVGFIDQDDALAPMSLALISRAILKNPQCHFLYTDEIIANANLKPVDYFLKPAFDPVLLSGVNYINHLSLFRRSRFIENGCFQQGFEGSQDYELLLRYLHGLAPEQVLHLPYPAYIWRRDGRSYSARHLTSAVKNARKALAQYHSTANFNVAVEPAILRDLHRVRLDIGRKSWPLVSVIIPNKNRIELISKLLKDLTSKTNYPSLEIIVIDNGSDDQQVLNLYEHYRQTTPGFSAQVQEEDFNFSRAINKGIELAKGEAILALNNDVEIIEPLWLQEMVSCLDYPGTGIVGAKLLYPNRTLQHAGVIVGLGGLAGHWFIGRNEKFPGPMGRLGVRQSYSAVTGACMLITRTCLEAVGPFDEVIFPIAYNDTDYCLKAVSLNFKVVWTPFACLVHHESASRGSDETAENIDRFNRDKESLRQRHQTDVFQDRAFNPWYSKTHSEPHPVVLSALPEAR